MSKRTAYGFVAYGPRGEYDISQRTKLAGIIVSGERRDAKSELWLVPGGFRAWNKMLRAEVSTIIEGSRVLDVRLPRSQMISELNGSGQRIVVVAPSDATTIVEIARSAGWRQPTNPRSSPKL